MMSSDLTSTHLTLGMLAVCAAVALFVAIRFRREVAEDSKPTTSKELYGPLEQAYYAGLMREEEYLRIREQMKQKAENLAVVATSPAPVKKKPHPPVDEWASWDEPGL